MHKLIILSIVIATTLTGCLGSKKAPDETRVVAGPTLILPPKFNLTPPTDGVATPAERAANEEVAEAQFSILGTNPIEPASLSEKSSSIDFLLDSQPIEKDIRKNLETKSATE